MDYKDTLLMPKTEFPMRGNLGIRELEFQKRWEEINLYQKVLEKNKDQKPFILHDGPPYANGDIHIGHALNKILKDFVLRYQTMKGHYVPYVPGWDTHGLPIETAIAKTGVNRKELSIVDYRRLCRDYALKQVERQKEQFKRLGILGDWDHPYVTLDPSFEANQIKIFAKMVEKGLIYKGLKPVYWSPSSESALAEAEIEYKDKQSISIYVSFDTVDEVGLLENASYLIWTTTPWTLPGNLAISVHPRFNYQVILVENKKYILAETLVEVVAKILGFENYQVLGTLKGIDLENKKYKHPLFDRRSPIILGEHVTDTDGTGLVHTAPGHGEDDYRVGKQYNLEILCPVDDKGYMTDEAHQFSGLYYEVANEKIVSSLLEKNVLLKSEKFTHSYPHDWRTGKPVIFRATQQWFASIEQIKNELLDEIKKVDWIPKWGELRMTNMVSGREDWCISRQRIWGVPIPVFYAENKEPILDHEVLQHVASLFEKEGSEVWYLKEAHELLPKGYTHKDSPNGIFIKETDTMDVWFDSGTSHSVLKDRNISYPADLYLEGSDQYRGWFNSSMITGVSAFNQSPYKKIVSHGFVLDGQGYKMSKSLGNTVDPIKVMKEQGADLLRLWVASVDYQSDVRISNELMNQISEGYRKIRNTFKFMLGNLYGFNPEFNYISYSMRGNLNRVISSKYHEVIEKSLSAYENYEFDKVYRHVVSFMTNELSSFYLDYTKDILYIEKENDFERRAVQSTIYEITLGLLKILTPIMPHTTSEAYLELPYKTELDVYLENLPTPMSLRDEKLLHAFDIFIEIRNAVLKKLEEAREQKLIGKSLQAEVNLTVTNEMNDAIKKLDMKINQVLIVSKVNLTIGDKLDVEVKLANGHTCNRCWNVFESLNEEGLCERCNCVIKGE
jgi:isoleucyl-tRNA synthetase